MLVAFEPQYVIRPPVGNRKVLVRICLFGTTYIILEKGKCYADIKRPFAGENVFLVDDAGELVPESEAGHALRSRQEYVGEGHGLPRPDGGAHEQGHLRG